MRGMIAAVGVVAAGESCLSLLMSDDPFCDASSAGDTVLPACSDAHARNRAGHPKHLS